MLEQTIKVKAEDDEEEKEVAIEPINGVIAEVKSDVEKDEEKEEDEETKPVISDLLDEDVIVATVSIFKYC